MNKREQLEELYLNLACLENLHEEIESLAQIRTHLAERVNAINIQLNHCRERRQRMTTELEHFNDTDSASIDFFNRDGQICQVFNEVSESRQDVGQIEKTMKVMAFEVSSLEDSIKEIEVEIDSLNRPGSIRTNPFRGH
ncbi:MAG TPA: hypothetical protein VFC63_04165 [Blastocatellia bacterium]|nr:hypothetical protein [Blastocatellia bacterium]